MEDVGNGTHSVFWTHDEQGDYTLRAHLAVPGGLLGEYFGDAFLGHGTGGASALVRVDARVHFDWGAGPLSGAGGADYVSVRWTGRVLAPHTEVFTFHLDADDNVRLWVDGQLVVDRWDRPCGEYAFGKARLVQGRLVDVLLEYRELQGDAKITLSWESASQAKEIVPASALYHLSELSNSPVPVTVASAETALNRTQCRGAVRSPSSPRPAPPLTSPSPGRRLRGSHPRVPLQHRPQRRVRKLKGRHLRRERGTRRSVLRGA